MQGKSIVNIVLDGHEFQGAVTTTVEPIGWLGSTTFVTGRGNSPEPWSKRPFNNTVRWSLFTARNILLAMTCNMIHGVTRYE